jgi:hypothetical protein
MVTGIRATTFFVEGSMILKQQKFQPVTIKLQMCLGFHYLLFRFSNRALKSIMILMQPAILTAVQGGLTS